MIVLQEALESVVFDGVDVNTALMKADEEINSIIQNMGGSN